jgi:membrane-associated phospholipid phosphatase
MADADLGNRPTEERSVKTLDEPALAACATRIEATDIAVAETLAEHRDNRAVRAVGTFSEIADQTPAYALCGAVLAAGLIARHPKLAGAGARMLASTLLATAMKTALKNTVTRTRPHLLIDEGAYEFGTSGPDDGDWQSFPSGHTADAVAAARALTRVFPQTSGPAYGLATVVAAAQIPRAKHYPLDVAAGALVGLAAEAIVDRAASLLQTRLHPRPTTR